MKKLLRKIFCYKRMFLWILLPLSFLLVALAKLDNRWVEHFFVPFIYKPISAIMGFIVSLFPFSVTEVLSVVGSGLLIFFIVKIIIRMIKTKRIKHELYKLFVNIVCALSLGIFLFEITMGLNYYRYSVTRYLDIEVTKSSPEDLYQLCMILAKDINLYRSQLETDENGFPVLMDTDRTQTSNAAKEAYKKLSDTYPFLKSFDIRNKPLLSSKLFSTVMTTGVYIPILCESNINTDIPSVQIPSTMCHELTHYRGFMREDEANFISYLACMSSDRADFRYSGTYMAFDFCYKKLYYADIELAYKVRDTLDDGIFDDVIYVDEYWDQYRHTVVAEVSDKVYDTYLEVNNQPSGLKSYGEMVDLLLAYMKAGKM